MVNRNVILSGTSAIAIALAAGGAAEAADMPRKAPPPPPPAVTYFTWAGPYVGGHLGYGSARTSVLDPNFPTSCCTDLAAHATGAVGGLQLGYNWQAQNIVWGVEGDVSAAGLHSALGSIGGDNHVVDVDLLASVRARLGLAFDRILVYATGGGGYVHGKATSEATGSPPQFTLHKFGGVVGGGVEFAYNDHLTLRAEALDYLVNFTTPLFVDTATIKNVWVARAGVNYKF